MKHLLKVPLIIITILISVKSVAGNFNPGKTGNQLYLTTNKELYSPKETICFQAFLVNNQATISTSIFVNLYDCSGNKITSKKLPLENNMASGSFVLPDLSNDYYLLYCYTLNNAGKTELDFIKKVAVQENTITAAVAGNKNFYAPDLSVEYFFEGGSFVNELSNNILIKTSTKDNSGIAVFGKIINEKNEVVSIFNTNNQGFVNVNVIPYKNEKCSLVIKDNNGNIKSIPLPVASSEGLTFRMMTFEKSIYYVAQLFAPSNNTPLVYTLEILKDNQALYQSDLKFDEGKSQLNEEIDNRNLPEGYLTFRIRDDNRKAYIERLYYNCGNTEKANTLQIIDTVNNKTYKIALPDYITGSGCISINAADKKQNNTSPSYASGFGKVLHTPELNTDINFSTFNDYLISVPHLNDAGISRDENNLLTLSGTLYSAENKAVKNKKVNVIIKENKSKNQFYETLTDKDGRIKIDNLLFFDTATVYYQLADKSEGKNSVKLVLDKMPNVYVTERNEKIKDYLCVKKNEIVNNIIKNLTDSLPHSKLLGEVIVKSRLAPEKTDKQNFAEKHVSPKYNYSGADKEFDFITNPMPELSSENAASFIKAKISEVRVDIGAYSVAIYNPSIRNPFTGKSPDVQVYIDDNQTGDDLIGLSDLLNLNVDNIALLRFYGPGWRPNPGGESGGTIMIYTKRGDEHPDKPVIGLPKLKITGYDSDISQIDNSNQPANNKTLFWKTSYSFEGSKIIYTNFLPDTKNKNIEVKIEGINNDKIPFTFIKNIVTQ